VIYRASCIHERMKKYVQNFSQSEFNMPLVKIRRKWGMGFGGVDWIRSDGKTAG
jgi:hypothetical protein